VTDAAVVLGYLDPTAELGADLTLAPERAEETVADLAAAADLPGARAAAEGTFTVANATMTVAIRTVTVERGHDPRDFGLVAFGGAGPMHAAALADRLGIERVFVPRANGVLSALGLLAADERQDAAVTHRTPLADADEDAIEETYRGLEARASAAISGDGHPGLRRLADCRYSGQSYELPVETGTPVDPARLADRFHAVHEREHGFALPDEPVELVTCRVSATVGTDSPDITHRSRGEAQRGEREAVFDGESRATPVYRRAGLAVDATVTGPAIVEGDESTIVVPPSWMATVDPAGTLVLEGST
jgi:N-methylhydantoinase A